jgi:hypothetical protein
LKTNKGEAEGESIVRLMPLILRDNVLHPVLENKEKSIVEGTNEIVLLKTRLKLKRRLEGSTGLQVVYLEGG